MRKEIDAVFMRMPTFMYRIKGVDSSKPEPVPEDLKDLLSLVKNNGINLEDLEEDVQSRLRPFISGTSGTTPSLDEKSKVLVDMYYLISGECNIIKFYSYPFDDDEKTHVETLTANMMVEKSIEEFIHNLKSMGVTVLKD